jgi:hypothetical protein
MLYTDYIPVMKTKIRLRKFSQKTTYYGIEELGKTIFKGTLLIVP